MLVGAVDAVASGDRIADREQAARACGRRAELPGAASFEPEAVDDDGALLGLGALEHADHVLPHRKMRREHDVLHAFAEIDRHRRVVIDEDREEIRVADVVFEEPVLEPHDDAGAAEADPEAARGPGEARPPGFVVRDPPLEVQGHEVRADEGLEIGPAGRAGVAALAPASGAARAERREKTEGEQDDETAEHARSVAWAPRESTPTPEGDDADRSAFYDPPMRRLTLLLLASSLLVSCDDGSGNGPSADLFVRPTSLTVEIDYESTAAPYGGFGPGSVFGDNVDAIFPFLGTSFTAPTSVGQMQDVGAIADDSLTSQEILALAELHRDGATVGSARHQYVIFVDGKFEDDTGTRDDILGVSIGYTGVIAMFKPVIASTSFVPSVRSFAEQTVLVHEFGHEIGLVDNGLAMQSEHLDEAHGAHCSNTDCVMYWAIQTKQDILGFITGRMGSGSNVLFAADCLADVRANYGE